MRNNGDCRKLFIPTFNDMESCVPSLQVGKAHNHMNMNGTAVMIVWAGGSNSLSICFPTELPTMHVIHGTCRYSMTVCI